jgi:hypothetical protein
MLDIRESARPVKRQLGHQPHRSANERITFMCSRTPACLNEADASPGRDPVERSRIRWTSPRGRQPSDGPAAPLEAPDSGRAHPEPPGHLANPLSVIARRHHPLPHRAGLHGPTADVTVPVALQLRVICASASPRRPIWPFSASADALAHFPSENETLAIAGRTAIARARVVHLGGTAPDHATQCPSSHGVTLKS